MISSCYPISGANHSLKVSISFPELDPESKYWDRRCSWEISTYNYKKSDFCYGIDEMQCIYLAFERIKLAIKEFEEETGNKCEYDFFPDISYLENIKDIRPKIKFIWK